MMTTNTDVKNGKANGTQLTVEQIILKTETPVHYVKVGSLLIRSVLSSDVHEIIVRHTNKRIFPETFAITSSLRTFKAKLPKPTAYQTPSSRTELVHMKANMFPIIINNATTGHKLQGCGVENLFVHNWHYMTNWPYVVMSRVKTINLSRDLKKDEVPRGYL